MINEVFNNYSLKILFGPMFGCDLHLPDNDYFLIINSALNLQDTSSPAIPNSEHAASFAASTLYIPCNIPSPNISLRLTDYNQGSEDFDFEVEIHDENGNSYKSSIKENEIFTHEHIKFAVKHCDTEWSDEIKNHHCTMPLSVVDTELPTKITLRKRFTLILIAVFISLILLCLGYFAYNKISTAQQVNSLSEALSGAPAALEIVKGRDNKNIYILAYKNREMEWAKEAIKKIAHSDNLSLILLSENRISIISELQKMGYPVIQLDYSSIQHPTLAIYRGLTPQEELNLKKLVLQKIPYALDINFFIKSKERLLSDAKQGLDRLNVFYRLIKTSTGYSLVVRDALSDSILNSLHDFIGNFSQQWGNTIITFSINLDENWLQNKSYVDSEKGYLFLNPRHWYFPLKNKEL